VTPPSALVFAEVQERTPSLPEPAWGPLGLASGSRSGPGGALTPPEGAAPRGQFRAHWGRGCGVARRACNRRQRRGCTRRSSS